jgi:D-alanine--poly(phosphoribitol) ligase subunit 2
VERGAVTDRVQRLFVETLNLQVPSPDTDLIDGGLLDSLALVELLFALEREFDVTIALEELDIDSFRSINRIAEFVDGARPA